MAAAQDLMSSPGKILEEEPLGGPLGMSQQQLACAIGRPCLKDHKRQAHHHR